MELCLDLKVKIFIKGEILLIFFEGVSFLESGLILLGVKVSDFWEHLFFDAFAVEFGDVLKIISDIFGHPEPDIHILNEDIVDFEVSLFINLSLFVNRRDKL